MNVINKKDDSIFAYGISTIEEFKALEKFALEDDKDIKLVLSGGAEFLIEKAAELSASKTKALDELVIGSVLGIKKSRIEIYARKYEDANAGEYAYEPEEESAIIAKHKIQMKSEKLAKNKNKHLYRKIEKAYRQVVKLAEKGKLEKANKALLVFESAGKEITEEMINNITSD